MGWSHWSIPQIINPFAGTPVSFAAPMHTSPPVLEGPGSLTMLRSRISPKSRSMARMVPP